MIILLLKGKVYKYTGVRFKQHFSADIIPITTSPAFYFWTIVIFPIHFATVFFALE